MENTRNAFYETGTIRNPCTKGNIDRSKSAVVEQTRCKCIFFVLNAENTRNAFHKTRAVRNPCTKGNIDRSKSALAEQTRCKCIFFYTWKIPEMPSIKRARFVILARKGILIVARVR